MPEEMSELSFFCAIDKVQCVMIYRQDPLVEYEFEEIRASIHYDREVGANFGWLALVKTSGNRKRMRVIVALAFFSQWSGNGLVYAILVYR